jgi:RecA-family ATPase
LARRLSVKKNNYGTTGDEITMTYDSGVFKADKVEAGLDKMASSAKAERVFLKLLQQVNEQGRRVNASAGVNFAPKLFSEMHDNEDVVKRGFKRAMEALLAKGTIKIVNDTSNKNRHRQHIEKVNS